MSSPGQPCVFTKHYYFLEAVFEAILIAFDEEYEDWMVSREETSRRVSC